MADETLSNVLGEESNIDRAVAVMLGDPTFGLTESECRTYKVLKDLQEKGYIYPNTLVPTEDYDEIEAGKAYQRKCDGVVVDSFGEPLTPGEKSHQQWLDEQRELEMKSLEISDKNE